MVGSSLANPGELKLEHYGCQHNNAISCNDPTAFLQRFNIEVLEVQDDITTFTVIMIAV